MSALQMRLLRLPSTLEATGNGRAKHYNDIAKGLMTTGVKIGARAVAWPSHEVEEICRARIAGASENELRALVRKLTAERAKAAPNMPDDEVAAEIENIVSGSSEAERSPLARRINASQTRTAPK